MLAFERFESWADVLAYVADGTKQVYYQAPSDSNKPPMAVSAKAGKRTVRVTPPSRDADPFTADAGHLDRFRKPVQKPSPTEWLWTEAGRAARQAHGEMMRAMAQTGIALELHLYFKRGALAFAASAPEGYELATPERCPGHLTADQLVRWTYERTTGIGCMPED